MIRKKLLFWLVAGLLLWVGWGTASADDFTVAGSGSAVVEHTLDPVVAEGCSVKVTIDNGTSGTTGWNFFVVYLLSTPTYTLLDDAYRRGFRCQSPGCTIILDNPSGSGKDGNLLKVAAISYTLNPPKTATVKHELLTCP